MSIAFPNISTGIFGYPKQDAAETALEAVRSFDHDDAIETVLLVCFDDENYRIYQALV